MTYSRINFCCLKLEIYFLKGKFIYDTFKPETVHDPITIADMRYCPFCEQSLKNFLEKVNET